MNKLKLFIKTKEFNIFLRYTGLVSIIYLFLSNYFLNSIATIFLYISYLFLNLFTQVDLIDGALHLANNTVFLIVEECIAPSAYILISIVFLTIPLKFKKFRKIFLYSVLLFSFFNLLRILLLMWIHVTYGLYYFEKYHLLFYQGLSGIVTGIIIVSFLRTEKIKGLYPIYSDVKYLISKITPSKK